jgi:hypothetical protein
MPRRGGTTVNSGEHHLDLSSSSQLNSTHFHLLTLLLAHTYSTNIAPIDSTLLVLCYCRLWASSGQKSLEEANVLLVGCDAAGCQALKNLVLPGKFQEHAASTLPPLFLFLLFPLRNVGKADQLPPCSFAVFNLLHGFSLYDEWTHNTLQGLPSSPSSPHLKSPQGISLPTSSYYQKVLEEAWQRRLSGTSQSLHRPACFRAQPLLSLLDTMARLLKELNPSVQGHPDPRSAKQVLEEDPAWFRSFGLVIVCGSGEDADVGAEVTRKIGKALWEGELQVLG